MSDGNRIRMFFTLLGAAILSLGGCRSATIIDDVPDSAEPGQLVLTTTTVEVGSQDYTADEGYLIVNENSADTNSRKIQLPVLRVRSSSATPAEPVFWLNGGPGMSNLDFVVPGSILQHHDVVLVGYRGVDGSTVLGSDEITDAMKGEGENLLGEESVRTFSEAVRTFRQQLTDRGVDINRYTMVDVIADFENARNALGYDRINLMSASYGTRVALLYAYLHPETVYRSVMVAANPPGRFIWDAGMIDRQIGQYSRLYEADTARSNGISLPTMMRDALSNMPSHWLQFRLDPGKIKTVTFAMLFTRRTAALVFDCYRSAAEGDYSGLYLLQRAYDFMMPSMMVWGEFLAKGGSADFDPDADYAALLGDSASILGSPLSYLICVGASKAWEVSLLPEGLRKVRKSSVQTLIVSGNLDFSTPAEYATTELLPWLPNGKQVILRDMGHVEDLMWGQPGAFAHLVNRFFDEGVVDESRFVYTPMDFDPPVSLPFWGKTLYPLLVLTSWL